MNMTHTPHPRPALPFDGLALQLLTANVGVPVVQHVQSTKAVWRRVREEDVYLGRQRRVEGCTVMVDCMCGRVEEVSRSCEEPQP